jgi:NADH:ubiquinone oxidoreductase subunit
MSKKTTTSFTPKAIKELKGYCEKAWQEPMEVSTNVPFSATVKKPRGSLSKHDEKPTVWHYDNGVFIAVFQPFRVMQL